MRAYIIRRLLLTIPTLWILTILVFLAVRFIPGDAVDCNDGYDGVPLGRGRRNGPWHALEAHAGIRRACMGAVWTLDRKVFSWHGTLGTSLFGTFAIEERIIDRLPVTIELGLLSIVIGLVIALPVGIYSAIRQDTAADYVGRTAAIIGLATPNFWLAIMVMLYPAIWWGWSPSMEYDPSSPKTRWGISGCSSFPA